MSLNNLHLKRIFSRAALLAASAGIVLFVFPDLAWSRASGLNNIPTTDVLPTGSYLLQVWSLFGEERTTQYALGLRCGISPQVEATLDNWHVAPSPAGDTLLALKYRLSAPGEVLSYAVGVTDVGAGEENPYLVASRQFEGFRGHLGFKAQQDNKGLFIGFAAGSRTSSSSGEIWSRSMMAMTCSAALASSTWETGSP